MASASVAGSRSLPFLLKLLLFIVFYHSNWHPTEDSTQRDYWFSVIPIKIPWTLLTQLGNKRLILKFLREHKRPLRHKAVWNKKNLAEGNTVPDSKNTFQKHAKMSRQTNKKTTVLYWHNPIPSESNSDPRNKTTSKASCPSTDLPELTGERTAFSINAVEKTKIHIQNYGS